MKNKAKKPNYTAYKSGHDYTLNPEFSFMPLSTFSLTEVPITVERVFFGRVQISGFGSFGFRNRS